MFKDLKVIIGKREEASKEQKDLLVFLSIAGFILAFGYGLLEIVFSMSLRTFNSIVTENYLNQIVWGGWFIISFLIAVLLVGVTGISKKFVFLSVLSSCLLALVASYNLWGIKSAVVEDVTSTKSVNATIISSNASFNNSSFTLSYGKELEVITHVKSHNKLKVGDKITEITKRNRKVVNTDVFGKRFVLKEEINYLSK